MAGTWWGNSSQLPRQTTKLLVAEADARPKMFRASPVSPRGVFWWRIVAAGSPCPRERFSSTGTFTRWYASRRGAVQQANERVGAGVEDDVSLMLKVMAACDGVDRRGQQTGNRHAKLCGAGGYDALVIATTSLAQSVLCRGMSPLGGRGRVDRNEDRYSEMEPPLIAWRSYSS